MKMTGDVVSHHSLKKTFFNVARSHGLMIPVALLIAFVVTILKYDTSPRYVSRVAITATGRAISQAARGSVVWLSQPTLSDLTRDRIRIVKSEGWQIKDGFLVSLRNQPAELILNGAFRGTQRLEFVTSIYSGEVSLRVNRHRRILNLTNRAPDVHIIGLNQFWTNLTQSYVSSVTVLFVPFTKAFLVSAICILLIRPLYEKIPAPDTTGEEIFPPVLRKMRAIALVTIIVFGLVGISFYPGVMMYDSYLMFYQTISHQFDDWHLPMMTIPWAITGRVIAGSGGMFLLHLTLVSLSCYLLGKIALLKGKNIFYLPTLIPLLPMVSIMIFVLMTDVSQAIFFTTAFTLWYHWKVAGAFTKRKFFCVLALLFYGSTVRHIALIASFPLSVLFFTAYTRWSRPKVVAASILTLLCFSAANDLIVYQILETRKSYVSQAVMSHDLMGIYDFTAKNYFPDEYLTKPRLEKLMRIFHQENLDYTTFVETKDQFMTKDPQLFNRLQKQWFKAIIENPAAYLKHRWIIFFSFLTDLDEWTPTTIVSEKPPDIVAGTPPPLLNLTFLGKIHTGYAYWLYGHLHFLFQGITYLLLSTGILIWSLVKKRRLSASLASSSLLYIALYFFAAPRNCFRYLYWPVFACVLSLCVIWIERTNQIDTGERPPLVAGRIG